MNRQKYFYSALILFFLSSLFSACTSVHKPSGFLEDYSELTRGEHFRQEYVASGASFAKYRKVKVNPVELRYFEDVYDQYTDSETQNLAASLKTALETELEKNYQILSSSDTPDTETLVIKPALIYVNSPKRLLNILTVTFIGFQFTRGSAAFETALVDGGTNEVMGEVTEKRTSGGGWTDFRSIFLGGFFRFTHAEGAFKRWAVELRELISPLSTRD